jgi:hypothetical protein
MIKRIVLEMRDFSQHPSALIITNHQEKFNRSEEHLLVLKEQSVAD